MRYLSCLPALLLSGCASLQPVLDPKTETELLTEDVNAWAEKKSEVLSERLGDGFPFYAKGKVRTIETDKLSEAREGMQRLREETSTTLSDYDGSMEDLRKYHDKAKLSVSELQETRRHINSAIRDTASDFEDEALARLQDTASDFEVARVQGTVNRYCLSDAVQLRNCKEDTGYKILRRQFYSDNPEFKEYLTWLRETEKAFESMADEVHQKGVQMESRRYMERARQSGCGDVSRFNFRHGLILAQSVTNSSFRPDESSIYDLVGFEVLQSSEDGILLRSSSYHSHNSEPIFVATEKEYTDGFTFQSGEQLVCLDGTKRYNTVLGARRTVHAFQMIHDDSDYYFIR